MKLTKGVVLGWLALAFLAAPAGAAEQRTSMSRPIAAVAAVEPVRWTETRFASGGQVAEVTVIPGERVEAGAVLARLDCSIAEAALAEAQATLATAQAHQAAVIAGPRAASIQAAAAAVAAAEGEVARAEALRRQLSPANLTAEEKALQAELARIQAERRKAEATLQWAIDGGADKEAEDARQQLGVLDLQQHAAELRLAAAPRAFAARIRAADAGIISAQAGLAAAQAGLALAQAVPDAIEMRRTAALVAQAEIGVDRARLALERNELRAPFAGTVTQVLITPGDMVAPGQAVITLATLDALQVRTVGLLEQDVAYLREGQTATIKIDALPGLVIEGMVIQIGLAHEIYRSDVTYPVVVAVRNAPSTLRWGMTAMVELRGE